MKTKKQNSNLKSSRLFSMLILVLVNFVLIGCKDWEVRNQRMEPTYVCEGDNINVLVTWDYSGPKAKVKITSRNNDVLCTSGARVGYCQFDRGLNQSDIPLKIKVYKKDELKKTVDLNYVVLSGTEATEEFIGTIDWSEPYEKTIEEKRPVYDENGNPTSEVEVVQVVIVVRSADKVKWELSPNWFTPRVIVESVKYSLGNRNLEIEGPGITRTSMNVGQIRPGNLQHPGGTWYGHFNPPIEVKENSFDIQSYGLILNIRCSE